MQKNTQVVLNSLLFTAVAGLGGLAWSQGAELDELKDEVARLHVQVEHDPRHAQGTEAAAVPTVDAPERAGPSISAAGEYPSGGRPDAPSAHRAEAPAIEPTSVVRSALESDDPELRDSLRKAIAEEQDTLREERWRERQQRREERTRERIGELAVEADLDATQEEQIEELLLAEIGEVSTLFRDARRDMNWGEARQKAEDLRAETDKKARDVLDEKQFEAYEKMRQDESQGFGRGGFGQGPGRRAGPAAQ